jgi:DNA-binding PucR family transcriptional regulator
MSSGITSAQQVDAAAGGSADDALVRRHVADVASALNEKLADVTRAMRDLLSTRIDELAGDPRLVDLLGASIEGNIDNIFYSLQHGISVDRMEPPTAAIEYARRLAQRGVPVNALVRAYRLGQQNLLEGLFAQSAAREATLDVKMRAQEQIMTMTFDYIDSISQQVVSVYEVERERWLADRNTVRASLVQDLVDGRSNDSGPTEAALGYRLRGVAHLGLILWSEDVDGDGRTDADPLKTFDTALAALSRRFGAGRSNLLLARDSTSAWAWVSLTGLETPSPEEVRAVLKTVPDAPHVAVGTAHEGVGGFRRTHAEAVRAQRVAVVAQPSGSRITCYGAAGLSLAALVCHNLDEVREWVSETLGPLAGDDEQHERLRETVRVLLEHGGSYTAAADALCMHRNTVRYRIGRAEAELGHPITTSRQSTDVALALCHWLGRAVLTPAP